MQVSIIGIDLAKRVFQVAAVNRSGKVISNRSVSRDKLLDTLRGFDTAAVVAMEACGSAHYWGRTMEAMGFTVRLIPAQHVKPFTRVNKTDAGDALAICEAALRPQLHFVPIKTIEQQDIQLLLRQRSRLVQQRTATANQLRGFGAEYGVIFPQGLRSLLQCVPEALESAGNALSAIARDTIAELLEDIRELKRRCDALQRKIQALMAQQPLGNRLQNIPGIGPLVSATFIAAAGNARQFKNGRQCAAWMGLVPRLKGSGGKIQTLGISKNGQPELRTAFIHAARALMLQAHKRNDPLARWALRLKQRHGWNKAVVALANKLARIAWAVAANQQPFDPRRAAAS